MLKKTRKPFVIFCAVKDRLRRFAAHLLACTLEVFSARGEPNIAGKWMFIP
jgi:hypothetical protein